MTITYIEPLSQAWKRMTKALFKPFDIGKWFVVGFTAFLAGLLDGFGGSNAGDIGKKNYFDWDEFINYPNYVVEWVRDNPGWFTLIIIGIFLLIAFLILCGWLSSRGKFMFLDNVVHDRSQVVKPWRQFKTLGNSLFLWRLAYGFICLAVFGIFLTFGVSTVYEMYNDCEPESMIIMTAVGLALVFLLLLIISAYISLFLSDFIVPVMYKSNTKTMQAWREFFPLFTKNIGYFILYGLLILFLVIVMVFFIILVGIFTCCIGWVFMIIPYIGTVVLLPVSYTFRAFSVEFLEQFGPEYKLFSEEEIAPVGNET